MAEATLDGFWRPDGHIELTGSKGAFGAVTKRTGVRFQTIPYPAAGELPPPLGRVERALTWAHVLTPPEVTLLALLTQAVFTERGLAPYVAFRNDPAPPLSTDATKAIGQVLNALLLDRRDTLRLAQLPDEIETRLGADIDDHLLQDTLEGNPGPRSRPLNALLLVCHAHKPLTPGELGTVTGHLDRELDATLRYLLRLPHARFLDAYRGGQIQVTPDGSVRLAGLTVSAETAVVVPEEPRWSRRRDWNRDRGRGREPGGTLRYHAGGKGRWHD